MLHGCLASLMAMADAPYLAALALVEQDGKRLLPLVGKSRSSTEPASAGPGNDGRTLALELMLRLWQRSDGGAIQRAAGEDSLLLMELPLEVLSEKLPLIKTKWIWDGDTPSLIKSLQQIAKRGWRLSIAKYEPVSISLWR